MAVGDNDPRFKPGDVVRYQCQERGERVGICAEPPGDSKQRNPAYDPRVWAIWRNKSGKWSGSRTWVGSKRVELHPDPDPVLASFTAWRLTQ